MPFLAGSFPERDRGTVDRPRLPTYVQTVRSRASDPVDRLAAIGMTRPDPASGDPHVLTDGHLHSDDDAICPRCLAWIEERHYVRRTAFGVLQHELCPVRED